MPLKMIKCPTCVNKLDRPSKAYVLESSKSPVVYLPFFDEEGRRHDHDITVTIHQLQCSEHHRWIIEERQNCWCGWQPGPEFTEVLP